MVPIPFEDFQTSNAEIMKEFPLTSTRAALEAQYGPEKGSAKVPITEQMLTIFPPNCFIMIGITAWLHAMVPKTFVSVENGSEFDRGHT